jgi:WD40 repeat protein
MTVHNNLVYSGGQDKTVQVHNYHTGKIIHVIHGHKGFVTGIHCFGDNIITASADQHVRCYSSKTFKLLQVCSYHSEPIYALAVSPSNTVYTGDVNGGVTAIKVDLSKNYVCKV